MFIKGVTQYIEFFYPFLSFLYFVPIFYYFCSQDPCRLTGEESIMLVSDYPDAVHNFLLSQKLTTLLGNFPEVNVQ